MKKSVNNQKTNKLTYIFLPLTLLYFEVLVRILTGSSINPINAVACVCISLAAGALFNILFSLTKFKTLNNILSFLYVEATSLLFLMTYYIYSCYKSYMDIKTIIAGAEGVVEEFSNSILSLISKGIGIILLFEIPALLFILFFFILKKLGFKRNRKATNIVLIICFIVLEAVGIGLMARTESYRMKMTSEYNFDLTVRTFSVQTAYKLDMAYIIIPNPFSSKLDTSVNYLDDSDKDGEIYGVSQLSYNYKKLAEETKNPKVRSIAQYIDSMEPSSKNQYTGLFKGKNIIYITVESMSKEMIQPDVMPTLYKLSKEGFIFEDYYQPYYNGSTATGEFANLLGLIPTEAMSSFRQAGKTYLPYT